MMMKTIPVMWTKTKVLLGVENITHSDMVSDLELHRDDCKDKLWSCGRCTPDMSTLYYYDFSELNNELLKIMFKRFIQTNM